MTAFAVAFEKFSPDQPRDDHGRFSTGDAAAAAFARDALAPRHGDDVRAPARELYGRAMATLHEKAAELAGKVRHVVTSTRFQGAHPVFGGGVELRATHDLPSGAGHVATSIQVNPAVVSENFPALATLAAIHSGLQLRGRPEVPARVVPVRVEFRNGAAPRRED